MFDGFFCQRALNNMAVNVSRNIVQIERQFNISGRIFRVFERVIINTPTFYFSLVISSASTQIDLIAKEENDFAFSNCLNYAIAV
jgi:hypothetical protein